MVALVRVARLVEPASDAVKILDSWELDLSSVSSSGLCSVARYSHAHRHVTVVPVRAGHSAQSPSDCRVASDVQEVADREGKKAADRIVPGPGLPAHDRLLVRGAVESLELLPGELSALLGLSSCCRD